MKRLYFKLQFQSILTYYRRLTYSLIIPALTNRFHQNIKEHHEKWQRSMNLVGLTLFLATLTQVPNANAQLGTEFKVNTYTFNGQITPSVASSSDGAFVITWVSDLQDGDSYGIFAQRFDKNGIPLGSEFQVNTYTAVIQFIPDIAMDSDGDFVITWCSAPQDGSDEGVYAQRYDKSGSTIGSEFRVNTTTVNRQRDPAIAMDSDGDFVITWASYDQDGSVYGIYAQRYDNAGNAVGTEFRVNTFTTDNQTTPAIAMEDNGDFIITWSSDQQDGSSMGVYAQRYDNSGSVIGSEFRANTTTFSHQFNVTTSMDSDGDFVITWLSYVIGDGWGVYAQRFNNVGGFVGTQFKVNTSPFPDQTFPNVSMDDDGDFMITWEADIQDGDGYGVYAQKFDNSGTPVGSEFRANTYTANNQSNPSISSNSDGKFIIVWQSALQDGSGYGIYAQRYGNTIPTISPQTFSISENSSVSTVVGSVIASDNDPGQTLSYTITAGNTNNVFAINSANGEITVTAALDFETTPSYSLTVEMTDNGVPSKNASTTITINITDISNENIPIISPQTFSISENSSISTFVGTVIASDNDAGQTLSYAITAGNTNDAFAINNTTGEITVAAVLDFETTPTYTLTIEVTDNGTPSKSASTTITINVTDIIETGLISMAQDSKVYLYPNPAKNEVNVTVEGNAKIKVLDQFGHVLKESILENSNFNIVDLSSGSYIIEISQNNQKTTKKLIVE